LNAIDTNIVVRVVTRDDPSQSERARAAVEDGGDVFVSASVILEAFWVLSRTYGLGRAQTAHALKKFAALETVVLEEPGRIMNALDLAAQGFDFADALHLGAAADCESFLTFDRKLIRRMKGHTSPEVSAP
jgi:predicted nucleic-acid-binding protein